MANDEFDNRLADKQAYKEFVACINVMHNSLDCFEAKIPEEEFCKNCKAALDYQKGKI